MNCDKQHYPNRKAAKKVARQKTRIAGKKITVYQCKVCDARPWHLTSCDSINCRTLREINAKDREAI